MPKPTASDVTLSFLGGLTNVIVDLVPITEPKKSPLTLRQICPECQNDGELNKPRQRYICTEHPADHHAPGDDYGFSSGELSKAQEIGTGKNAKLFPITPEEIEAVKEPELPEKEITFEVVPAEQFERTTRPTGGAWRIRAESNLPVVAMLTDLVSDPAVAMIGEINMGSRSGQKFVRATVWNGCMVLQEHARPEEVYPADPVEAEYPAVLLERASAFVQNSVTDFDPEAHASSVRARAKELADAKLANPDAAVVSLPSAKPKADATQDLLAALEASLEATAKPKAKAKKAS